MPDRDRAADKPEEPQYSIADLATMAEDFGVHPWDVESAAKAGGRGTYSVAEMRKLVGEHMKRGS